MKKELTTEEIAINLLSDISSYKEFIQNMLVKHLETKNSERIYWDAWFRGATGEALERADGGVVFEPRKWIDYEHVDGEKTYVGLTVVLDVIRDILKTDKDLLRGRNINDISDNDLLDIGASFYGIQEE
jgi:hypothetical protein